MEKIIPFTNPRLDKLMMGRGFIDYLTLQMVESLDAIEQAKDQTEANEHFKRLHSITYSLNQMGYEYENSFGLIKKSPH